jgi:hypothetical protein
MHTLRVALLGVVVALQTRGTFAQAQPTRNRATASTEASPMVVVAAAQGAAHPVLTHTRRHRVSTPYEQTLRATLVQGQCYEVLGYASGVSPVFAQVLAGRARIGDSIPLTNSVSRVARQRFCARESGELYSLHVRAEGAAWWYLAVVPIEGAVSVAASTSSARVTASPAPPAATVRATPETFALGDGVPDYVTRQIELFARQRPGLLGLTRTARSVLPTNGVYESGVQIPSGRCINVVAVGVPSVADLVVELEDPAGHRVAQDATRRGTENIRYCAPYAGRFRMRVRVYSGSGLVGVQALIEPQ